MRRTPDFVFAFVIALLLHGLAGYCAGTLLYLKVGLAEPLFKAGESSVELTLLPPVVINREPEHRDDIIEPPEQDIPPLEVLEPKEEKIEQPEQELNTDLLEKGVENVPKARSKIRPQYPFGARIRGEEGVVVVSAVLDDAGRAADVTIIRSSGYHSLDRAAVKALKKALFYAEAGGALSGKDVEYTFRFKLRDGF